MSDTGCPSFRDIVGNLFCIVLSVAMILFLLPLLNAGILPAWVLFAAFCAVIVVGCVNLGRGLFPARWRRCSGSALVMRIVEIEGIEW
jgi:hypothetical protein